MITARTGVLVFVTCGLVFCTISFLCHADNNGWEMLGPLGEGGLPYINPENPDLMYCVSSLDGMFRTSDGGKYWTWMKNGFVTKEIKYYSVFAVDPLNWNRIFIGVSDDTVYPDEHLGLYRSDDGGETWTRIWVPEHRELKLVDILTISYTNPDLMFCLMYESSEYCLGMSIDGGSTWTKKDFGGSHPTHIEFHPSNPNLMIISTYGALYYSWDSGQTWSEQTVAIPGLTRIDRCVSDPANPFHLYIMVYSYGNLDAGGIFESTDGGVTWDHLESCHTGGLGVNFYCDPVRIYGTKSRSHDGGITFVDYKNDHSREPSSFLFHPTDPDWVWMTHSHGIKQAMPGGLSWYQVAFDGGGGRPMFPNPNKPDLLLSVTSLSGVHKSLDAGDYWYASSKGLDSSLKGLLVDPTHPETMYAYGGEIYKTTDEGETWTSIVNVFCEAFEVDPIDSNNLYASIGIGTGADYTCYVVKSTDAGQSWLATPLLENIIDLECSPFIPGLVYATNSQFLDSFKYYVSSDYGQTWFGFDPEMEGVDYVTLMYDIECDPFKPNVMCCATYDGFRKSLDYGFTWFDPSPGYPFSFSSWFYYNLDPFNEDTIYLNNNGLYRSTEGGSDWTLISDQTYSVASTQPQTQSIVYQVNKRTDIGWPESRAIFRKVLHDEPARILWAGYGTRSVSASQGGVLQILCEIDAPESSPQPLEVELLYQGMTTGLFLNDQGINGDEIADDNRYSIELEMPPGDFAGVYSFELIVRDATGVTSDRWPKFKTR